MGRSKTTPKPKRQRLNNDEGDNNNNEESAAVEMLLSTPQVIVEEAAAVATRDKISSWPVCQIQQQQQQQQGLGQIANLPQCHFKALQSLQESILSKASTLYTWSGDKTDPRRRAFGFLPKTLGANRDIQDSLFLVKQKDQQQGQKSMVIYENNNKNVINGINNQLDWKSIENAINYICDTLRPFVLPKQLQSLLQYQNLIAAQPNLHMGRHLLPAHVDNPLQDGFGVIIVTVAMSGNGDVFFVHSSEQSGGKLTVNTQSAYMLSGQIRNEYTHGVVAHENEAHRTSLNLRFGLHDYPHVLNKSFDEHEREDYIVVSSNDVLKHW